MLTTVFKSGNSLAVRIPRKLWPAEGSLAAVLDVFQEFDASYMSDGREVKS